MTAADDDTGAALRWTPRAVDRLGLWACGEVPLKAYAIRVHASPPLRDAVIGAAAALVAGAAEEVAATPHEGAGFVVLHRGTQGLWLLLHWWMSRSICAQRLWRAEPEGAPDFEAGERPLMACVWELALIDHERRAYVRTMMAGAPDAAAYLRDIYRPDFC